MNDPADREIAVFNAALLLPATQRADYLDEVCVGDAELRQRVETLLQAYKQAGAFLEEPAAGAPQFPRLADPQNPRGAAGVSAALAEKQIGRAHV